VDLENKIKETVNFAYENSLYYGETLKKINNMQEFEELPIINGDTLKKNLPPNNTNLLSGPLESAFVFSTGGTTGTPKYSFRDLKDFNDNHLYFDALDIKSTDVVANLFTPGIWGTYTSHNIGLEQVGCVIVPIGASDITGNLAELNIKTMQKLGVNTLLGTPSIIVLLINKLKELSIKLDIKKVYTVGEMMFETTANYIKSFFDGVNIKSMYGSVDCAGIGVQCINCNLSDYHVLDYVYVEILDDDNNVLPKGSIGNIVVTVLKNRLVPIIRYKLGDQGVILKDKCNCGKEILRVLGRCDDKFIVASAIISLKSIEDTIKEFDGLNGRYQIKLTKKNNKDQLTVIIEAENASDDLKNRILESLYVKELELEEVVKEGKCNEPEICLVPLYDIEVNSHSGKIKRIIEERK